MRSLVRRFSVRVAIVVAGAAAMGSLALADDWPQWRGPKRDGRSHESGISRDWKAHPPRHLWTVDGMGQGYASLAIAGGRLYTMGNTETGQSVICANAETGQRIWATAVTKGAPNHDYAGSRSVPTIDGDRLYVVSSDGAIACLQTSDGSLVWQRPFSEFGGRLMSGWGFSESPLVDGDHVICTPGGPQAMLVALDKRTGRDAWRCAPPAGGGQGGDGAGYSSAVISYGGGVKQYVQIVGHGLIGVRASDGQYLWGYDRIANGTANIPTPLVSGDYVFASTGYGAGAALLQLSRDADSVSAQEVYFLDANIFQNHHGGMVLDGDYIYAGVGHGQGFPMCLEWKTGQVKWGGRLRGAGDGSAGVAEVGDLLIFRYQNGIVALISATPDGYHLQGTLEPDYQERESWSHPVVVNGRLYMREQDKLMCYDISGR